MNIERLNHMIKVLEGVEAAQKPFSLQHWAGDLEGRSENIEIDDGLVVGERREACGTVCCAVGYAALDPEFQAQGLKLEVSFQNLKGEWRIQHPRGTKEFNAILKRTKDLDEAYPLFENQDSWSAVMRFFDLTERKTHSLFNIENYGGGTVTPRDVIERIQALITEQGDAA